MRSSAYAVLVDTNAMTRLSLYVESCRCAGTDIGTALPEIEKALEKKSIKKEWLEWEQIKEGHSTFEFLERKRKDDEYSVFYLSLFGRMELLHVLLERAFDEELSRKYVPYRIRKKNFLKLQVDFDCEKKVFDRWKSIEEDISSVGIEFTIPEREEGTEGGFLCDIVKTCELLLRYIVLEPVDLYLYALGVFLMVDDIYTYDQEFRKIINSIRSNRESGWDNTRHGIQEDLKNTFPKFKEEFESEKTIRIPKGIP